MRPQTNAEWRYLLVKKNETQRCQHLSEITISKCDPTVPKGTKGNATLPPPPSFRQGESHEMRQGHGWIIFQPKTECYIFQQLISIF